MHMDALIAMGRVHPEGDKGGAHIGSGFYGAGRIRAVIFEDILLITNIIFLAQTDQLAIEMIIKRPGLICHGDGDTNSEEFCPGAEVPLSTEIMDATSGVKTEDAPTPTSSAMVKRKWISTGVS